MSKIFVAALCLSAGTLGGVLSHYMFPPAAYAAQDSGSKEIRAQQFVVVNEKGVPMGLFGLDPKGLPVLRLVDENGRVLWTAPARAFRGPDAR